MDVFKAYDIRGIYEEGITKDLFENIGKSIYCLGDIKTLVVGGDMRASSKPLKKALIEGARKSGINVIDIGLASTPMLYQASADFNVDLGIIITASHNSKEYNGMKICRKNAVPISYDTGLNLIEKNIEDKNFRISNQNGELIVIENTFKETYIQKMNSYSKPEKKIKIVFDSGNGMGGYVDFDILKNYAEIIPLYIDLDGTFPNHEANPIKEKNLGDLSKKVIQEKADFGVAFDGDADRIGIVDENGEYIGADIVGAFLIEHLINKFPEKMAYSYDLRSTKSIKDLLDKNNKKGFKTRVGHSYIKDLMRKENSFFSMELSGHMYFWFDENVVYDSALRATIELLNAYSEKENNMSKLLEEYNRYPKSPETNFNVKNKEVMITKIKQVYSNLKQEELDGITIEADNWWANIRASNTENVLRLNLEANNQKIYDGKFKELCDLING